LKKEHFKRIIQAIEMLKAIEVEFKTKKFLINKWVVLINRYTCELITRLIENGMHAVYKMKKGNQQNNMMQLMMTILECYKGGYNAMRRQIVKNCLNLLSYDVFSAKELEEINFWNWKLDLVSNWELCVRKATRCRFVYWHRALFPVFLREIVLDKHRLNQMNYYLMALQDPLDMLNNIRHLQSAQTAVDNYKKDIYEAFQKNVTQPICQKTEEELRQQIHCILIPNMAQINPTKTLVTDVNRYSRMNDLYLFEKQINIGAEIKKYLSHIFYEMSALSPHDFRTYEHMKELAADKLGITVLPSHLPSQQLEQGVDIMMLVRDTEKYVREYHYNLHTQIFVERTSDTKQIKTIGVQQMVFSIRTHGVGILANVMNQLYRFMRRQINNFCKKFLLDDTVKNMLFRESRIYTRDKEKLGGLYPYQRAAELARQIKMLAEGENYLETVRKRITQIGNTLGYVRMIKNASLKDNQNLLKFIPSFLQEYTFEDVADDLAIGGETLEAVKMFDESVRLMQKQGTDANDYLRNMVANNEGFADKSEATLPLKNFYALVPAVSICYIDHVVQGRDRLIRRNNTDAFISDDGFPLGVVYLLKILGVTDEFSSLNWFESIATKLEKDKQISANKRAAYKGTANNMYEDDNFEEELSIKRLDNLMGEYN